MIKRYRRYVQREIEVVGQSYRVSLQCDNFVFRNQAMQDIREIKLLRTDRPKSDDFPSGLASVSTGALSSQIFRDVLS